MKTTLVSLLLSLSVAVPAFAVSPPETFFEHVARAWVVGDVTLGTAIKGTAGGVLGFPATVADVAMSRVKNARNALVLISVDADGKPEVDLKKGDVFFGPLVLSARTAHWKENLPQGPKHKISGGARYVFQGEGAVEARRVVERYAKVRKLTGGSRRPAEIDLLSECLSSPNQVIREDAMRQLSKQVIVPATFSEQSSGLWKEYLAKAEPENRATLALVAGRNGLEVLRPALTTLAKENPEASSAALVALDKAIDDAKAAAAKRAKAKKAAKEKTPKAPKAKKPEKEAKPEKAAKPAKPAKPAMKPKKAGSEEGAADEQ